MFVESSAIVNLSWAKQATIDSLPTELIFLIMSYLPLRELPHSFSVQRSWNVSNDIFRLHTEVRSKAEDFGYGMVCSDPKPNPDAVTFIGHSHEYLKALINELKELIVKRLIPPELVEYRTVDKPSKIFSDIVMKDCQIIRVAYERTLLNCKKLTKEKIFSIFSDDEFFVLNSRGAVERTAYPLFIHILSFFLKNRECDLGERDAVTEEIDDETHAFEQCLQAKSTQALGILIAYGVDINTHANEHTSYHLCISIDHLENEIVGYLLEKGAEVDLGANINYDDADVNETYPLIVAALTGSYSIVELLLDYDADVACEDVKGDTALHKAVKYRDGSICNLLLESGADVNAKNLKDNTPLHLAASLGNPEIVALLLSYGPDRNQTNRADQRPIDLAESTFATLISHEREDEIINFKKCIELLRVDE